MMANDHKGSNAISWGDFPWKSVGMILLVACGLVWLGTYRSATETQVDPAVSQAAVSAMTAAHPELAMQLDTPAPLSDLEQITMQAKAELNVIHLLKDEESAKLSGQRAWMSKGIFIECGLVNAKNSFGGYTGSRRFLATTSGAIIEGEGVSSKAFRKVYRMCPAA